MRLADPSERLKQVFGDSFLVLPRFRRQCRRDSARPGASTAVQDGDALAVVTFHQRMARVREGVARLDDALQYAEALGNGDALTLQVAQLPQRDPDRWVGLPAKPGTSIPAGRLSLIVHMPEAVDFAQPLGGLLIDEWVEVVPNASETTGVVFQYNQPDSVAPQAILIAVHPNPVSQNFWTVAMAPAGLARDHRPGAHACGHVPRCWTRQRTICLPHISRSTRKATRSVPISPQANRTSNDAIDHDLDPAGTQRTRCLTKPKR